VADDYASQGWEVFAPHLSIYGFDADADACDAANAEIEQRGVNWTERHIPLALSNSIGESTLYVTYDPMCSSLYPPNEPFMERFNNLATLAGLDFTIDLETTTLDAFCQEEGIETIDFLQIDVQGADLKVLQGASQILDSVLAIQVEVEFSPLYLNQPLFADVDQFLRLRDFSLFDLTMARRLRTRSPVRSIQHPGQLLWGDAYYFCDLLQTDVFKKRSTKPEDLLKLACVADVMNFTDYAVEILEHLTVTFGKEPAYNFANVIVEVLAESSKLFEQDLQSLPLIKNVQKYLSQESLKLIQ
jgi:FkbM family methyltransferase